MHSHINVSSHSILLVWKRNCRTSSHIIFEGGIAGLEAKVLVWQWNCGTSSRNILCGSGTTGLSSFIPCAKAECQTLNSHNILCAKSLSTVETEFKIQNVHMKCT